MFARFTLPLALGCALLALPLTTAHAQQNFTGSGTYTGNGGGGFGGPVGNGALTLTYNSGTGTVSGSFATAGGFSGNDLVLYLDVNQGTAASGLASTATLTDNADGGRTAISGFSSNGRTTATFATGFRPTYAISLEPGVFGGLFSVNTTNAANFTFINSVNLSSTAGTTAAPLTFSFALSDLGLNSATPQTIGFVGSLISTSGYRSNETIGTSITVPGTAGDTPNAGFTGTQTFATFNSLTTFAAVVPEANTFALIGIGVLPLAGVALRRRKK